MKKTIIPLIILFITIVNISSAYALTCTADSSKTIELDGTQQITVSCSGFSGETVDVSGTYTQTCIEDISGYYPSATTLNSQTTVAVFTFRAKSMACQNNPDDRKITWRFTPSSGTLPDKYTTITITSPLSISASFTGSPYSAQAGASTVVTLTVSTSASTDINNIQIDVSGSDSSLGLTDKSISKIAASAGEKTQSVSWTITAPSTIGTYTLNAVVTSQNADSDTASGSLIVSSSGGGSSNPSGGSSGGGGGAGGATQISETQSIASIPSGKTGKLTYLTEGLGLQEISIKAREDLATVVITATKYTSLPDEISTPPQGVIYHYLKLTALNINETKIDKATIKFKINKTWILENNLDKTTVKLNRYANNEWQRLPTTLLSEDNTYIYYEAETPGFSVFAITAEKPAAATPNKEKIVCNNNGVCEEGETITNCPNDCKASGEEKKGAGEASQKGATVSGPQFDIMILLGVLAIVIILVLFFIHRKKTAVL